MVKSCQDFRGNLKHSTWFVGFPSKMNSVIPVVHELYHLHTSDSNIQLTPGMLPTTPPFLLDAFVDASGILCHKCLRPDTLLVVVVVVVVVVVAAAAVVVVVGGGGGRGGGRGRGRGGGGGGGGGVVVVVVVVVAAVVVVVVSIQNKNANDNPTSNNIFQMFWMFGSCFLLNHWTLADSI